MAYLEGNPYIKELEDNKQAYDEQRIDKDKYQANARTLRRKAREWDKRQGDPTGTAPAKKTTKRARKPRKPKVTYVDQEKLKAELMETFSGLEEHELQIGESCHAITWPSIVQAKMAEPEKNAGSAIMEKFRARWLQEPKWYAHYYQGDIEVYALGPIVEVI